MTTASAQASALIPASPERVYAVLRDYVNHHPHILPQQVFVEFQLLEGGQGAGTVFRGKMRILGQERPFHMRVSEPAPAPQAAEPCDGPVYDTHRAYSLVETDLDTGLETTFSVQPQAGAARVTIRTQWQPAGGLAGWIERRLTPGVMRKIYQAELEKLAEYVQRVRD